MRSPITFLAVALAAVSTAAPTPLMADVAQSGEKLEARQASKKRGLAFNDASLTKLFKASNSKVSWEYNWQSSQSGAEPTFEYVPMLFGTASSYTNSWNANVDKAYAAGSRHVLAFNEPDISGLSPAAAAAAYKQWIQPLATKYPALKLGSPAVTNGANGVTWLQTFISACTGCKIDFVATHWYNTPSSFSNLQAHVNAVHNAAGKPVWVTEFGVTSGTDSQITSFLSQALPWLDAQSWVEKYAYFYAGPGSLVNSAGNGLSTIGQYYNTA